MNKFRDIPMMLFIRNFCVARIRIYCGYQAPKRVVIEFSGRYYNLKNWLSSGNLDLQQCTTSTTYAYWTAMPTCSSAALAVWQIVE